VEGVMKILVLFLTLSVSSVSFAEESSASFANLQQQDLQILGIAGVISLISYEVKFNNLDFNFNPLNQKLTFNIKF
jgi:hypothetical protein